MNDTFLKACRGEKVDYTPVWMMRQAGRYLPEYQQVRNKLTFLELCKTPELAAEVTIQPVDILGVDAAILFSDILIPLEAMGLTLEFHEKIGPVFPDPVRDRQAVDRLIIPDPEEHLDFVLETIRILRRELAHKVPLIGFAGAPFTLATYLVEGGSSKFFFDTKKMMFADPELYSALLEKITECTSVYLQAQAAAGAQAAGLAARPVGRDRLRSEGLRRVRVEEDRGLAADGESIDEDVVRGGTVVEFLFEFGGLGLQLVVVRVGGSAARDEQPTGVLERSRCGPREGSPEPGPPSEDAPSLERSSLGAPSPA